ncbi:hypothetical protein KUV57_10410 [Epibacterium sp. DP7N7-1]|nr:hypothetical protein [Epibacterium sp. DP7N7-1]
MGHGMTRFLTAPLIAASALIAPAAHAQDYWEYGDWRVIITEEDTGEDLRRICHALTGGDGMPTLRLEISNGDAGPPHGFPTPTYFSSAPRGHRTQIGNAQGVAFVFDQQGVFFGVAEGGFDDDGIAWVSATPRWQDVKNALLWMKAASHMEVRALDAYRASTQTYVASMNGFTAAYGKMMDSCGHSIEIPR